METGPNIALIITFLLAGTFNVVFPILLGWWIIKKKGTNWKLFGVGVLTFIGSQVVHLPLVAGLTQGFASGALPQIDPRYVTYFNAATLGLLAGICEETARWVGYRLLKKKGDSFGAALTLGAGHGGVEAIIVGVSVLATLIAMLVMQSSGSILGNLPDDQAALAWQQMQAYWATPWHMPFAGAVERISALGLHISLSVMVWLAVSFRKAWWFWAAVLYHGLIDGLTVLIMSFGVNIWLLEVGLLVVSFSMLALILKTAKKMDQTRDQVA